MNVYKKAKNLLFRHEKTKNKFNLMLGAGICPECGEDLVLKTKRWTTKKKRGIIFKKEIDIPHSWDYFACPKGHKIINPQGEDRSYPGCCEYNGFESPNIVIRGYWLQHFSGDDEGDY